MPQIRPPTPAPLLTPEQRAELRHLHFVAYKASLASAEELTIEHPDIAALLDCWESCKTPSNLQPPVKAYKCRDGWLIESVPAVLQAIAVHVREP